MERKLLSAKTKVNRILKQMGDATLDWTIQISLNSIEPDKVSYACQIHVPARGVQPLTWICDTWEELMEKLDKAGKEINEDVVEIAFHNAEIARCEKLINYHKEKISEITDKES